jgi:methyl-accepting chemotaxis protein
MLGNLRISYKLLMLIGLSVLGITAVAGVGLSALWNNLLEDRKAKLQDLVLVVRQVVDLDYQTSRRAGLTEAEAVERTKALLHALRFGKDDYFYALNMQGVVVANPNPKVEGRNLYDAPDSDGFFSCESSLNSSAPSGEVSCPFASLAPQEASRF